MFKAVILLYKVLFTCITNRPDQQFINEVYQHEQSRHYQRHYGIGSGPHHLPPGKYLNRNSEII